MQKLINVPGKILPIFLICLNILLTLVIFLWLADMQAKISLLSAGISGQNTGNKISATPAVIISVSPTGNSEPAVANRFKYKFAGLDMSAAATMLKKDIPFSIIIPKGAKPGNDEFSYSFLDSNAAGNFKDFDFIILQGLLSKDGKEIDYRQTITGEGGSCDDQYALTSNIGELNVCQYLQQGITYYQVEFVKPLGLENNYHSRMNYIYVLNGNYTKAQLQNLFKEFVTY